jgi:hypothetical protein
MKPINPITKSEYLDRHRTNLAVEGARLVDACLARGTIRRLYAILYVALLVKSMLYEEGWDLLRYCRSKLTN